MEYLAIVIIAALVFGVCYLCDKGFQKLFRNQAQHHSGLSVRLNKRYAAFGAILVTLGVAAFFAGMNGEKLLMAGGVMLVAVGIGLIVYYATFGIFYDGESFVLTTFGRKTTTYRYLDIQTQQLYTASGNIVIELSMSDGRCVSLQSAMTGVYDFLDTAFDGWCRQKSIRKEDCAFHDPANSCWFPTGEET